MKNYYKVYSPYYDEKYHLEGVFTNKKNAIKYAREVGQGSFVAKTTCNDNSTIFRQGQTDLIVFSV